MNEHAGPACALSVLIVGAFAILLHDKNPPPPAAKSPSAQVSYAPTPEEVAPRPRPLSGSPPQPSVVLPEPQPPKIPVTPPSTPAPVASPLVVKAVPKIVEPPKPLALTSPKVPEKPRERATVVRSLTPPTIRSSFTIVQDGETLRDVAVRVYGTSESMEVLWRANRDQILLIDSPLPRGTLLRTP